LISSKNCDLKEPYCLTAIYKCNLQQDELDEKYMGFNSLGRMMNDPLYGHISCNSSICTGFKLKLGYNVKQFLLKMESAMGKNIVEHVIRLAKVISASLLTVRYAPLLLSILTLRGTIMILKEWWMGRQV
jgi:hypothetical protein